MLSLTTHLTLETVKSNEKLQKFIENKIGKIYCDEDYNFSLADIIDNAYDIFKMGNLAGEGILKMCQQEKPLKEIELYILSNLK